MLIAVGQTELPAIISPSVAGPKIASVPSEVYSQAFDSQDAFNTMTVINTNNDKYTWGYYNGTARVEAYNDLNDWLVTPGLQLEAGKSYDLSFIAWGSSTSSKHRIGIKWGKDKTAAAMTLGPSGYTTFNQTNATNPKSFETTITVEETGVYYIGIQARSNEDNDYLFVDNIKLSAPVSSAIPAAATDLKVTPDPDGNVKATISFTAPALDDKGNALESLDKIELYRGNEIIKSFSAPAVGSSLSYEDSPASAGEYTYKVIAFNSAGTGREASVTAYVGLNLPAAPDSAYMIETLNSGVVTVKWKEVNSDANGNPMNPELISYVVAKYENKQWTPLYQDLKGSSLTFRAVEADAPQKFVYYGVFSKNSAGMSGSGVQTNVLAVGKPYDSLHETFPDGSMITPIGCRALRGHGEWTTITDSISSIRSQDEDNGMMTFLMDERNDRAEMTFGKVSLAKMAKPMLSFYSYVQRDAQTNNSNLLKIELLPMGQDPVVLFDGKCGDLATENGWKRLTYSLDTYKNTCVSLRITSEANYYRRDYFDNFIIDDIPETDLHIGKLSVPKRLRTGRDYTVGVTVYNNALAKSEPYSVELYQDGELVDSKNCEALEAGSKMKLSFARNLAGVATDSIKFKAVIKTGKDDNPDNNVSPEAFLRPVIGREPAPQRLVADKGDNNIVLNWNAPDLLISGQQVNEGFEDLDGFNHSYQGWTFLDLDKKVVGGLSAVEIPGVKANSATAGFFTFDASHKNMQGHIFARTGDIFLISLYAADDSQINDWAISPILDGKAQTISFWAQSLDSSYPEAIEVLWSDGSVSPVDFHSVLTVNSVPGIWTKYEANIPDGAKRFAVRSCATGAFALMLDDFTFCQGPVYSDYTVNGYNVYRNGKKINSELVSSTTFTDREIDPKSQAVYSYEVTALLDTKTGNVVESGASNLVSVKAGVGEISHEGYKPVISTTQNLLKVNNADGLNVTVYTVDGRIAVQANGNAELSIDKGIYLVKVGRYTFKVYVP